MKNNDSAIEFLDHLEYEEEAVMYHGKKYFFHGYICSKSNDEWTFNIDIWYEDEKGKIYDLDMIYYKKFPSKEECKKAFFDAKIFDGKTFWEAESEMEWIPW